MLRREISLFMIALQFFTRIPVTGRLAAWVGWSEQAMNDSARYFPLVGALVGAFGAAVYGVAVVVWPPVVALLLSVSATVWLTGAFHEDGWADTCDALGGRVSRERALEIMKDSRLGTYGTLGLMLMLALKLAALWALPHGWVAATMIMAHTASRASVVLLSAALPYGGDRDHAKAKPLVRQVGTRSAALAAALGVLSIILWATLLDTGTVMAREVAWVSAAAVGATLVAIALFCARWFTVRLGGYTGDTLGATQQLSELGVYLCVAGLAGLVGSAVPVGLVHGAP